MHCRGGNGRLLVLAGALAMAGCGSGAPSAESPSASGGSGTQAAATGASTTSASKAAEPAGPPKVVLKTSAGEITLELDPKASPRTVDNFLQYVDQGQYQRTIFHQVVDGYVLVGGSYDASLQERPGSTSIRNEAHNGLSNVRGTIAMARDPGVIDSSTCQFFINLGNNAEQLDHKGDEPDQYGYCVFGRVVAGLDVCDKIAKSAVRAQGAFEMLPVETVQIESAKRLR